MIKEDNTLVVVHKEQAWTWVCPNCHFRVMKMFYSFEPNPYHKRKKEICTFCGTHFHLAARNKEK